MFRKLIIATTLVFGAAGAARHQSDGQLGDWVRDLRQLADRIEDTRP